MASLIILVLFIISVWAYIKIMNFQKQKEENTPVEEDDSNKPDFSPYLAERIKTEEEEEEEEDPSYDEFLEY